ncbi:MAG: chemotaxis protein CheY [Phycisphaerales bacterium]|nr:chemotaxis protein CheY [Phycisphaerales bacterium]
MNPSAAYVLIVEDDPVDRHWLLALLKKRGIAAEQAATLQEGFDKLTTLAPLCVLLDLGLPDGNGVEVLRHIRRHGLPIKVAIITGSDDYSTVGTAMLLQPDILFRKPVDAAEVMSWVATSCC